MSRAYKYDWPINVPDDEDLLFMQEMGFLSPLNSPDRSAGVLQIDLEAEPIDALERGQPSLPTLSEFDKLKNEAPDLRAEIKCLRDAYKHVVEDSVSPEERSTAAKNEAVLCSERERARAQRFRSLSFCLFLGLLLSLSFNYLLIWRRDAVGLCKSMGSTSLSRHDSGTIPVCVDPSFRDGVDPDADILFVANASLPPDYETGDNESTLNERLATDRNIGFYADLGSTSHFQAGGNVTTLNDDKAEDSNVVFVKNSSASSTSPRISPVLICVMVWCGCLLGFCLWAKNQREREIRMCRVMIETATTANKDLQHQNRLLSSHLASIEDQLNAANLENADLLNAIAKLESERAQAVQREREDKASFDDQIIICRRQLEMMQKNHASTSKTLLSTLKEAQTQRDDAICELQQMIERFNQAVVDKTTFEGLVEKLNGTVKDREMAVEQGKLKVASMEAEIYALNVQKTELFEAKAMLTDRNTHASLEINKLRASSKGLANDIETLTSQVTSLNQQLKESQNKLSEAERELRSVKAILIKRESAICHLKTNLNTINGQLKSLREESENLKPRKGTESNRFEGDVSLPQNFESFRSVTANEDMPPKNVEEVVGQGVAAEPSVVLDNKWEKKKDAKGRTFCKVRGCLKYARSHLNGTCANHRSMCSLVDTE